MKKINVRIRQGNPKQDIIREVEVMEEALRWMYGVISKMQNVHIRKEAERQMQSIFGLDS